MENKRATIKAISIKKGSVLLTNGKEEKWLYVEDNIKPFLPMLEPGECEFNINEDKKIIFIKNTETKKTEKKDSYDIHLTEESIRAHALKSAVFYVTGQGLKATPDQIINFAKIFEKYIRENGQRDTDR